jgi:hypothetical protein
MPATLATVEAYLTAAQTAFASGDYVETKKQVILGEIELSKLIKQDGLEGQMSTYRDDFRNILDHIEAYQNRASQGTRRSTAKLV